MSIFKNLIKGLLGSGEREIKDRNGMYFYIRCSRCGMPVRVRVDKYNDFQIDYDTGERTLRKEIMDGGCFSLMYANVRVNAAYKIIEQDVEGGEFISWETYKQLTQPQDTETENPASK